MSFICKWRTSKLIQSLITFIVVIIGNVAVRSACWNTLNVTLYPSRIYKVNITVFWDARTWLEAVQSCESFGVEAYQGFLRDPFYDYILASVARETTGKFNGIWFGNLSPLGTDKWFNYDDCTELAYMRTKLPTPADTVRCLMINDTVPLQEDSFYSISCDTRLPYVCKTYVGKYTEAPNSYIVYNQAVIREPKLNTVEVIQSSTEAECIDALFHLYKLETVASMITYANDTHGVCEVLSFPAYLTPAAAVLERAVEKITTIIAQQEPVAFNESDGVIAQSMEFPCQKDVTALPKTSTIAEQTTTPDLAGATNNCCTCARQKSEEEIEMEIRKLKENLKLKTRNLTSYQRRLISAPDGRISSAAMGTVAIVIMVTVVMFFVSADFHFFYSFMKKLLQA